jgi:hypothetical protein
MTLSTTRSAARTVTLTTTATTVFYRPAPTVSTQDHLRWSHTESGLPWPTAGMLCCMSAVDVVGLSDDTRIWLVRATDPRFEQFEAHGVVALNCKIGQSIAALRPEQIVALGPSKQHARELARIHEISPGDVILATDSHHPNQVLIGIVEDLYEHRPGVIDGHPHMFSVTWRGRIPRQMLTTHGAQWKRSPVAIDVWTAPDAARDIVLRAAAGEIPRRDDVPPRTQAAPSTSGGVCGSELLSTVRRRLGRPADWLDEAQGAEPRIAPCPINRCDDHTKHRYWLDLAQPDPVASGPNLVIVGINPTCPDIPHPRNTTFQQARRLARGIGAASCVLVNLATRRTANQDELLMVPDGDIVGPRQEHMLALALSQADLVVLAFGRLPGPVGDLLRSQHQRLLQMLDKERADGLVVAHVTDFPRHPRAWTAVAGHADALAAALCSASPNEDRLVTSDR